MPFTPKRPCKTPGCPNPADGGFCAPCIAKRPPEQERPTAAQRGYGYRWQKASKAYLRKHPFAVDIFNEHKGRVFRAECVDHIEPHSGDPVKFWDQSNWQGLTLKDHSRKSALENAGRPLRDR